MPTAERGLRVGLIGVGLIGASWIGALRRAGVVSAVSGWDPDPAALRYGRAAGLLEYAADHPHAAAREADLVVLAAPPLACVELLETLAPVLRPEQLLTDTASIKCALVAAARAHLGPQLPRYVPGHPIAGGERNGPAAADPELFRGRDTVLTPLPETDAAALRVVEELWGHCGARVLTMEPLAHDAIFAAASHLPHFLAYALVDFLSGLQEEDEIFRHAAGGFADFTRIASSSPRMWSEICAGNREQLLPLLRRFEAGFSGLRRLVEEADWERLEERFRHAKRERDTYLKLRGEQRGEQRGSAAPELRVPATDEP